MTKEEIIKIAIEAGFDEYKDYCLSGDSEDDELVAVSEYPVGEPVLKFAYFFLRRLEECEYALKYNTGIEMDYNYIESNPNQEE